MKKKQKSTPKIVHKLGDKHFIGGTACSVRFINHGCAWLTPVVDDKDDPEVSRHIAYAKIDQLGIITLL